MSLDNNALHNRNVSVFFDTQSAAEKATNDLVAAGIPRAQISLTAGQGAAATAGAGTARPQDTGFWESLKELFIPEEDAHSYAEGLRRGGYLLSVRTDDSNYARVIDILDVDGAVNMDQRETEWRSQGWSGFAGTAQTRTGEPSTGSRPAANLNSGTGTAPGLRDTPLAARSATAGATGGTGTDQAIPVYEETLRIGKRDINHGRVRVRSYVVETPVSEQVSLHDESVQIERRPVNRAIGAGEALFQDRVIEAEEHTEEAVVSKEARVKEEITLRKTAENRTQTVTDSVRHTEVEVEDDRGRGKTAASGLNRFVAATDSAKITEHMDVITSEGTKIGTVDHLDGPSRIKLAKTTSPDGQHHTIPLAWIDHVDTHVHLNKTSAEAKAGW